MATKQEALRRVIATKRPPQLPLNLTTLRWVAGIGSVLALLMLVAIGAAPERQPGVATPGEVVTDRAQRPQGGRGEWMGYTRALEPDPHPRPVR